MASIYGNGETRLAAEVSFNCKLESCRVLSKHHNSHDMNPGLLKQTTEAARLLGLLSLLLLLAAGEGFAGGGLVLLADLVGDEAVLRLLRGALVVLRALLEDLLLHPVDALGCVVSLGLRCMT